jgi:hypothetical protein
MEPRGSSLDESVESKQEGAGATRLLVGLGGCSRRIWRVVENDG